jgi:hypothetical protein
MIVQHSNGIKIKYHHRHRKWGGRFDDHLRQLHENIFADVAGNDLTGQSKGIFIDLWITEWERLDAAFGLWELIWQHRHATNALAPIFMLKFAENGLSDEIRDATTSCSSVIISD